jgi:acyl-CoA reductase-like NAD-dependent aldehyde dehydrogenase
MIDDIKMETAGFLRNFMGAVIDKRAFEKISEYVGHARQHATIVAGGKIDGGTGYFISPTLVEAKDPAIGCCAKKFFGPVVTTYVYDDAEVGRDAEHRRPDVTVALTGAVFALGSPRCRAGDIGTAQMRPGISTSTTSRPAQWSASSRLAARERRERTTRPVEVEPDSVD